MLPSGEFICLRLAYREAFWDKLGRLKAYLHAAICRADLSAPRNREANREANRRLCGRDWFCQKGRDIPTTVI